jgi:hypothetical protein
MGARLRQRGCRGRSLGEGDFVGKGARCLGGGGGHRRADDATRSDGLDHRTIERAAEII